MSIDTWLKLQSECLDTLNRTDLASDVSDYTPGTIEGAVIRGISKAERRIVRRLRTREFETSTAFSVPGGIETSTIPSDFVMMKTFIITSNPRVVLQQKDLTALINDNPTTGTGIPNAFSSYGTSWYLNPIPASTTSLKAFYYASPTPMDEDNPSNILLTKYPDLMLYGALIEITAHVEDDNRIQLWKQAFDEAIKDITEDNTLNRWSGVPITSTIDVRGVI